MFIWHRRKVLETTLDFRHSLERVRPGSVFSLQFCDTASKATVLSAVIVCSVLLIYFLSPLLKFSWAWIWQYVGTFPRSPQKTIHEIQFLQVQLLLSQQTHLSSSAFSWQYCPVLFEVEPMRSFLHSLKKSNSDEFTVRSFLSISLWVSFSDLHPSWIKCISFRKKDMALQM